MSRVLGTEPEKYWRATSSTSLQETQEGVLIDLDEWSRATRHCRHDASSDGRKASSGRLLRPFVVLVYAERRKLNVEI